MDTRDRWQRLQSWFHRLDALDEEERDEQLARLEDEAPEIHASLARLFEIEGPLTEELALERLARAEGDSVAKGSREAESVPPERIGPYRILGLLGSGGMGTVYEAEQVEHVHRRVALKLMREGFDSRSVVARFHRERQALAVMDHPNIARVLDAGTTEDGRPFFVMELVDGQPITEWADRRQLSLEERISLFLPVCRAVQHAHTKGVVHRDLKPTNILVADVEGEGVPKVIDFGIAKAIEQPEAARTLATGLGVIVGTPAYMSPEQATFGRVDVDTRSDVYGLGLVLYELLVGELPHSESELSEMLFDEICRRIREDETPRPSSRVSRIGAAPGDSAPVERWRRRLRGDLDRVLLKALAKSRELRYDSAASFAADLERFLADLPVEAAPPSVGYRLGKLVRRHRTAVATALVAALLVLAGLVATTVSWLDARSSETEARQALRTAERTTDFLVELFRDVAPEDRPGVEVGARELLDRGAAELEESLEEEPGIRAALWHTLGRVYGNLPAYERSEEYLRRALEARKRATDPDPLAVADTWAALGEVVGIRERYDEAEELLGRALETRRRLLGEHPDTAVALEDLGSVLVESGDLARGEALLLEAVAMRRRLGDELPLAESLRLVGILFNRQHRRDLALQALEESLALYESEGETHSLAASETLIALGGVVTHRGEKGRAVELFRRAAEIRRELAGEESHAYSWSISMLAWALMRHGELEEAEKWMREGLVLQRQLLGEDHSEVGQILGSLGRIVQLQGGEPEEVEALYQESLEILERSVGPDHSNTVEALIRLSRLRLDQGRLEEAEELGREVLRRLRKTSEEDGPGIWYREALLGDVLRARGDDGEAEALLRPAWENLRRVEGEDAGVTTSTGRMLAELYRTSGRPEEARRILGDGPKEGSKPSPDDG